VYGYPLKVVMTQSQMWRGKTRGRGRKRRDFSLCGKPNPYTRMSAYAYSFPMDPEFGQILATNLEKNQKFKPGSPEGEHSRLPL
ncbi:MAG: hypothetical protein ACE5KJ_05070, partial [Candidatus Zixiibacteriota bacterium]